jgi:hypothetical protein
MVLGRFKEAVSDVAETIRRAFKDPPCRSVATSLPAPAMILPRLLEVSCQPVDYRFEPAVGIQALAFPQVVRSHGVSFEARLCGAAALSAWATGTKLCEMPIFRIETCRQLSIPPLPRAASAQGQGFPPFRAPVRGIRAMIAAPMVRGFSPRLPLARVHRDLEMVLGLPIAIAGEDFQNLPRALNMRYTFQLVKATGENIRNLDVLGVFAVPVKGVA